MCFTPSRLSYFPIRIICSYHSTWSPGCIAALPIWRLISLWSMWARFRLVEVNKSLLIGKLHTRVERVYCKVFHLSSNLGWKWNTKHPLFQWPSDSIVLCMNNGQRHFLAEIRLPTKVTSIMNKNGSSSNIRWSPCNLSSVVFRIANCLFLSNQTSFSHWSQHFHSLVFQPIVSVASYAIVWKQCSVQSSESRVTVAQDSGRKTKIMCPFHSCFSLTVLAPPVRYSIR